MELIVCIQFTVFHHDIFLMVQKHPSIPRTDAFFLLNIIVFRFDNILFGIVHLIFVSKIGL